MAFVLQACGQGRGRSSRSGDTPTATPSDVDPVPPSLSDNPATGPYSWNNVVIKGGGFVTGVVFSHAVQNLIFARTDVGGAYRWNTSAQRWVPITDWVGRNNSNWMGIESIALDPTDPSQVYLAAGTYLSAGNGVILHSTDFGNSFTQNPIPVPMGGNENGRSMGERLAVDPKLPSTLYFASRVGLWRSTDSAATWQAVTSFPLSFDRASPGYGTTTLGLSFVSFDPRSGSPGSATPVIYVGVASLSDAPLYRSLDAGQTWQAVPGAPSGLMAHHAAWSSGGKAYFTFNSGPGPNDIGRGVLLALDTATDTWNDISPPTGAGLGGVSADATNPNTLLASTLDWWSGPDEVYRTTDGGQHWVGLVTHASADTLGARWLYFGSVNRLVSSGTGWVGDVELDPFDSGRALYITGQGVWWSDDVTAIDRAEPARWAFRDDGLEETVALDLTSPAGDGAALLLSAVGDICGFRHDDLSASPSAGMYTNPLFGNTTSIDFAEGDPSLVVRVGTGNALQRGALSTDGGRSWQAFQGEPDLASGTGTGQGTVAIAADGSSIVWAERGVASAYSTDRGKSWTASSGLGNNPRVVSDRVNPALFYAVSNAGVLVSSDGGASFTPAGGLTGLRGARIKAVFGLEGDVWLGTAQGLYHSQDAAATFTQLDGVQAAFAFGFGRAAPGQSYPAIYLIGTVDQVTGMFRSDDAGASFVRIDDDRHQFGFVSFITGDQRVYGRAYIGTGGRGVLYGDPL